jgi:hypothetical protein
MDRAGPLAIWTVVITAAMGLAMAFGVLAVMLVAASFVAILILSRLLGEQETAVRKRPNRSGRL